MSATRKPSSKNPEDSVDDSPKDSVEESSNEQSFPKTKANSSGKINVLEVSEGLMLSELGEEERAQLFDKLSKDNPLLPKDLFMTFRGKTDRQIPTIPEAIIRMIINESAAFQASGGDHLVPHLNMLAVPVLAHQTTVSVGTDTATDGVIRVAFDVPTRAVAPDGTPRSISAKTSVAISGIKIQGCEAVASQPYIPSGDIVASGRVSGILPNSIVRDIGLGAAQRCSAGVSHPTISPGSYVEIGGLPVKLPHIFNFSELPAGGVAPLLHGILEWVRWVGESSYRQSVLAYHDFRTTATAEPTVGLMPNPIAAADCPSDLAVFNALGQFETGCAFHQTTRLQLRQLGLERAYDALIIKGKSATTSHLDAWKNSRMLEQWNRTSAEKVRSDKLMIKNYTLIIAKKFGDARGKKFADDVRKMRGQPIQNILKDTLKPSELSVVSGEYKRQQEYLEGVINNKCPHLRAARDLRRAVSDSEISTAYAGLRGYFAKTTKDTEYISCNKCGFGIICPHKRILIEMDLKHAQTSAVKAAISPFVGNGGPGSALFCKVCGETLSGLDALESYEAPRISHSDELAQFMWGEIAPIMRHFRFGPQIAVSQLITTVRDACYQYIFDIEKRLIRAKTSSAAEILAKKKLYVDIYGFAYMILLITKNPGGQIEFRGEAGSQRRGGADATHYGGAPPPRGNKAGTARGKGGAAVVNKAAGSNASIVDLIKGITATIVVSRNVIIRDIRGMTPETIRNTLIDAYKLLSSQSGSVSLTTSDVNEDIASDILLGCVYEAFYRATVIGDLMAGRRAPKSEFDIITRLNDIMGGRLESLHKKVSGKTPAEDDTRSIFDSAKVPRWSLKEPAAVMWTGGKHVPLFKFAANWYFARGFELFAERVISRLYTEPIWKPVDITRLDDYTPVKYTEKIRKYAKSVEEFTAIASVVERSHRLWSCQLYKSIGENKRRSIPRVGLDRIYGADGHVHKWDKMAIGDQTLTEGDFITATTEGKPMRARDRSDLVCSVCGEKKSATGGFAHDSKIISVLHKQVETSNFYRFYESRCPAGGNHEWGGEGKNISSTCSKCNYVQGKQSVEYQDKWFSTYSAEKTEMNDFGTVARRDKVQSKPPKAKTLDWSFDYNMITKFAEVFEVRPRIIMALGVPEIIDWNAITAGTWTPPAITSRDHPRVFAIRGMIANIVRGYNRLRLFKRIFKVPQSVLTLIEAAGINRTAMNGVADTLPAMPAFDADFDAVYAERGPAEIIEWLVEKFCEACMWFVEQKTPEPGKTLMNKYIREYISETIRSEELKSKPGYFNWSLLYGDSIVIDDAREASGKKQKDAVDDGDEQSPFSMDNYDMEEGDADDDAHSNHAGDELGM